jgi:hypothetical protein
MPQRRQGLVDDDCCERATAFLLPPTVKTSRSSRLHTASSTQTDHSRTLPPPVMSAKQVCHLLANFYYSDLVYMYYAS